MNLRVSLVSFFLAMALVALGTKARAASKLFDVRKYGAVADGKTDNTKAFLNAWRDACQWKGEANFYIPEGDYSVGSIGLKGPCAGSVTFSNRGVLKAPEDPALLAADYWIRFQYIDKFALRGGTFDGQGAKAWSMARCTTKAICKPVPVVSLRFDFVTNSSIQGLRSVDSKNAHINIFGCKNLKLTDIHLSAPGDSPNTDGIKIGSSENIAVSRATISTGDDCFGILAGTKQLSISGVFCGPGHGISVGSLGGSQDEDVVSDLFVKNCTLRGTDNGVRIKTWASPTAGKVYNILYQDIFMDNVQNPIVIDQYYCPHSACKKGGSSNVQISHITYKKIWGSSSTQATVSLNCSRSKPCDNIVLEGINLSHSGGDGGGPAKMSCSYAKGVSNGIQNPPSCL